MAQEQATYETQASDGNSPEAVHDGTKDALANKTPSKEEIHAIQIRMKTAGVNPGEIDGIMGPKTITALRRFQSGCVMVNDLLKAGEGELYNRIAKRRNKPKQAKLRATTMCALSNPA
jgi:peptidoglycan hydrolase-like protein with peptidoglycan-binding domain